MTDIDIETFNRSTTDFIEKEGRAKFFLLAKNLIAKNFEAEGLLLILTTWNFASFRYALKDFNIEEFKKTLDNIKQNFDNLTGTDFRTINLDNFQNDIKIIFNELSKIKGIEYTGAPKLMHLKNPDLFIMWDSYIRGEKALRYYGNLDISKMGIWKLEKYTRDFDGYFLFLKDMQKKFRHLNNLYSNKEKTFAKAIDEFNYVNITLPIQTMESTDKKKKKSENIKV